MIATLEQQLLDLCEIHGLSSISIHAYRTGNCDPFVSVNVHGDNALGSATGRDNDLAEVFKSAMLDLRAKQLIAVPALVPMGIAA